MTSLSKPPSLAEFSKNQATKFQEGKRMFTSPKFSTVLASVKKKPAPSKSAPEGKKKKKTWSEWTKGHVGRGASALWDHAWRYLFGKTLSQIRSCQVRLAASQKTDWNYFSKDSKELRPEPSDTTKLLLSEISLLKSSVRAAIGFKPVSITLRIPFQLVATVTSGVVATVVSCVPGTSSEFASLAAIFDEYKCTQGHVQFVHFIRSAYVVGAVGSLLNNSMLVIAYDNDATALTSVIAGTEFAQHHLYPLGHQAYGSVESFIEKPYEFHFKVTPGVAVDTVTGSLSSGSWAPTASNSLSYGFLKAYSVGSEATAIAVASGVVHLNCEFRTRE